MMSLLQNYDYTILHFLHHLALITNGHLTPFFRFISYFGDKGLFFILLGMILLIFKKTRKLGLCILISLLIGTLFTNLFLKNIIARHRPYLSGIKAYHQWWQNAGSLKYNEFSFPSGHTTATMAVMTCFFLFYNKKYSWIGFLFVVMMGMSRNYFMVHYPTDVLGGIIVGGLSSIFANILLNTMEARYETYNARNR